MINPNCTICETEKWSVTCWSCGGKCATCRLCWSKDVAVVAYPAHGKKMLKHIDGIAAVNL